MNIKNKKIIYLILISLFVTLFSPMAPNALAGTSETDGIVEIFSSYDQWDANRVYNGGDMVSYDGVDYRAKWWTQGEVCK